jgi:hypothetical protein
MPGVWPCRLVATVLWALAAYDTLTCRGLFWDGAAFLVSIVDTGTFHDFYPARAHVGYITQLPVLIALKCGVTNLKVLAMIQTAALFALPVGLYHFAMFRVRHDALLLAAVLVVIALVYMPTSFFIIGEYNVLYAAATAAFAVVLTVDTRYRKTDAYFLCALAVMSVCSYEAMVYFGPLLAAAMLWWIRRIPAGQGEARAFAFLAIAGFLAGTYVSCRTIVEYWHFPHFALVRLAILDFWQNQQFLVPLVGLGIFGAATLAWPGWLRTPAPAILIGVVAIAVACTVNFREWINLDAMNFPPAHYVARTAAGCLLWALLVALWICVAWRGPVPGFLEVLRDAAVGRRLTRAMVLLVIAAAIPDVALTRLWSGYLDYYRGVVSSHTGRIPVATLPDRVWPWWLFNQQWSVPALSALLRSAPGQAIVTASEGPGETPPFDSRCGTLPRLVGYRWPA